MRALLAAALGGIFALASCSASPSNDPSVVDKEAVGQDRDVLGGGTPNVKLTSIVNVNMPVAMAVRPGDNTGFYLVQQTGVVIRVQGRDVTGTVLDIRDLVRCCGEEGLLGITFSPNGARMYLYHTDNSGDNDVVRYDMRNRRALRGSRRLLLEIGHPTYANHNGGAIYLNPVDNYLYIATGDGGSGGDPNGNGQNINAWLGKILRIDPRGSPYRNPPENPFVGQDGRNEILHYGLRNPWRFTIDPETQMMWIGDVGQGSWEEIDRVPPAILGANLGWDRMEGRHSYDGGTEPANHHRPIYEYANGSNGRCAVTGGAVMHDPRLPGLEDVYVFSDFCDGVIRTFRKSGDRWVAGLLGVSSSQVSSFGVGRNGRIFVLSLGGRVSRIDPR
jgi:glucose/arabinose dehydrogenase